MNDAIPRRECLRRSACLGAALTGANGLDGADGERNRISVRQEADCIRVRLDLATPAGTP